MLCNDCGCEKPTTLLAPQGLQLAGKSAPCKTQSVRCPPLHAYAASIGASGDASLGPSSSLAPVPDLQAGQWVGQKQQYGEAQWIDAGKSRGVSYRVISSCETHEELASLLNAHGYQLSPDHLAAILKQLCAIACSSSSQGQGQGSGQSVISLSRGAHMGSAPSRKQAGQLLAQCLGLLQQQKQHLAPRALGNILLSVANLQNKLLHSSQNTSRAPVATPTPTASSSVHTSGRMADDSSSSSSSLGNSTSSSSVGTGFLLQPPASRDLDQLLAAVNQELQLQQLLLAVAPQLASSATALDLVDIFYGLASLRMRPGAEAESLLLEACSGVLVQYEPAWHASSSRSHTTGRAAAVAAAGKGAGRLRPKHLSLLLWSLAALDIKPNDNLRLAWFGCSASRLESFNPQDISNVAWALGTLGLNPPKQWLGLYLQALDRQGLDWKPQGISNTLWGLAKLGCRVQEGCLLHLLQEAAGRGSSFTPQELCNTLWAVAKIQQQQRGWDGSANATSCTCSNVRYYLQQLLLRCQLLADQLQPSDWSNLLWACGELQLPLPAPWQQQLYYCMPKLEGASPWTPQALAISVWGLARLRVSPPVDWWAGWEACTAVLLPKCSQQYLAVMLWGLGVLRYRPSGEWWAGYWGAVAGMVEGLEQAAAAAAEAEVAAAGWPAREAGGELPAAAAVLEGTGGRQVPLTAAAVVAYGDGLPKTSSSSQVESAALAVQLQHVVMVLQATVRLGVLPPKPWVVAAVPAITQSVLLALPPAAAALLPTAAAGGALGAVGEGDTAVPRQQAAAAACVRDVLSIETAAVALTAVTGLLGWDVNVGEGLWSGSEGGGEVVVGGPLGASLLLGSTGERVGESGCRDGRGKASNSSDSSSTRSSNSGRDLIGDARCDDASSSSRTSSSSDPLTLGTVQQQQHREQLLSCQEVLKCWLMWRVERLDIAHLLLLMDLGTRQSRQQEVQHQYQQQQQPDCQRQEQQQQSGKQGMVLEQRGIDRPLQQQRRGHQHQQQQQQLQYQQQQQQRFTMSGLTPLQHQVLGHCWMKLHEASAGQLTSLLRLLLASGMQSTWKGREQLWQVQEHMAAAAAAGAGAAAGAAGKGCNAAGAVQSSFGSVVVGVGSRAIGDAGSARGSQHGSSSSKVNVSSDSSSKGGIEKPSSVSSSRGSWLLHQVEGQVQQQLLSRSPDATAFGLQALAELRPKYHRPSPSFLAAAAKAVADQRISYSPKSLATALYRLGKLGYRVRADLPGFCLFLEQVSVASYQLLPRCGPGDLVTMLVGMSLVAPGGGALDSGWVHGWLDESAGRLRELKGHQLAAVAHALTRVKADVDPVWMGRYLNVLQLKLRDDGRERITAKQLVAICGFLSEAGVQPGMSFISAVAACVEQQLLLEELQPHQLGLLAVAWKRLGWEVPRELRGQCLYAVTTRLTVVTAAQLAQCLRLLAAAGWKVSAGWAKRAERALAVQEAAVAGRAEQYEGTAAATAAAVADGQHASLGAAATAVAAGAAAAEAGGGWLRGSATSMTEDMAADAPAAAAAGASIAAEAAVAAAAEAIVAAAESPPGHGVEAGLRLMKARRALKSMQLRRCHQKN